MASFVSVLPSPTIGAECFRFPNRSTDNPHGHWAWSYVLKYCNFYYFVLTSGSRTCGGLRVLFESFTSPGRRVFFLRTTVYFFIFAIIITIVANRTIIFNHLWIVFFTVDLQWYCTRKMYDLICDIIIKLFLVLLVYR